MLRLLLLVSFALLGACTASSTAFVQPDTQACGADDGATGGQLRVVSYNIKSGLMTSLDQVADQLAQLHGDIIALQEVDVGVKRTNRVDQAAVLAQRLGMQHVFAGAIKREGGDYGIALLSRLPFIGSQKVELAGPVDAWEHRVAIDASICIDGQSVRVVALHADNTPWGAAGNAHSLVKHLGTNDHRPMMVLGDLNATPNEEGPAALEKAGLDDTLHEVAEGPTFGGDKRIDYIFVDPTLKSKVLTGGRVESAVSDHLPVFVDFSSPR